MLVFESPVFVKMSSALNSFWGIGECQILSPFDNSVEFTGKIVVLFCSGILCELIAVA